MSKALFFLSSYLIFVNHLVFAEDIRDIKPPLSLGFNFWTWLVLLFILILLAVGIWYFLKRKKQKKAPELSPRPAHEIALERLDLLRKKNLAEKGMIKEFYVELSDIVRRYIEARFSFRAPEMTTEEFLFILRHASVLSDKEKELLKVFLMHCDMVKFAKYRPTAVEIEQSLKSAEDFIVRTKKEVLTNLEDLRK